MRASSVRVKQEDFDIADVKTKRARLNQQITARELRLIGADGEQVGIVPFTEAIAAAEEAGLDLVEIAPNSDPPVCRVMDYGKYLFEQSKRQKKKSKQIHVKEIKLRPVTDVGDYQVKIRKAIRFLELENKVKFIVRFRGREMAHKSLGIEILKRVEVDLADYGTVEHFPQFEGLQMAIVIAPAKKK